ncbi:GNAT family N-acetyltransferase [Sphingomonas sp. Leaf17]|uniref:GNAT family N-acetyltransferase n=1 Tax=Sphingomonas sp. Leaf17 TaxID=1735683 RepID=UPI000AFAF8E3|nr:GNAT family N-acetyltransferase [Sphingomonas sp. Leaf17]
MSAVPWPLKLQVGARRLATIRRRLVRVPFSLDMVRAGVMPVLPTLPSSADGYLVTSLPVALVGDATARMPGALVHVTQRYVRYHADLSIGHGSWLAGLSTNARAAIRRKTRRLAEANGGRIDVRACRDVAGLATFYESARAVSATTYQERLIGDGLPDDAESRSTLAALAAAGCVRAWLLFMGDRPAAYLWCSVEGDVVRYDHVGHDPAFAALSPGAVLHAAAMRDLQDEGGFRWFDFTEGEGQHKRQFATGGTPCVDLLMLRRTPGNRATVAVLAGFAGAVGLAKRLVAHPRLTAFAKRVRR